jgi:hypothetical protein
VQDLRIEVDVLCDWQTDPQAYRLYINNDLYTERTYIWRNPNQWLREIIVAELEPGEHTLTLQPVNPNFPGFRLTNFAVNNKFQNLENGKFTV